MSHVYGAALAVHVVAALNALPSFWIALFLEKGSRHHRWVGRLFVRSMIAMAATGGLLAAALAWDPHGFEPPPADVEDVESYAEAVRRIGSSLVFVSVFSIWLVAFGCRALRRRGRSARERWPDLAIAAGLAALGAAALPFADRPGWEGLDGGGTLLLVTSAIHLQRSRRTSAASRLVDHIAGILGAGGVLHAALAVQVVPRLLPGFEGERMFAPGGPVLAVAMLLTSFACVYYRRRLARARTRSPREGLEILAELATDQL